VSILGAPVKLERVCLECKSEALLIEQTRSVSDRDSKRNTLNPSQTHSCLSQPARHIRSTQNNSLTTSSLPSWILEHSSEHSTSLPGLINGVPAASFASTNYEVTCPTKILLTKGKEDNKNQQQNLFFYIEVFPSPVMNQLLRWEWNTSA
jgi:hypothetical protein